MFRQKRAGSFKFWYKENYVFFRERREERQQEKQETLTDTLRAKENENGM
jgi:hypothetical protein